MVNYSVIKDVVYGRQDTHSQTLDLHIPDCEKTDLLVYFHGGSLESGDKDCEIVKNLANQGITVVSANYRMYPAAKFPDFVEDAAMAVDWALKHISEYVKVDKVFVGGSSAGAWLTAMLAYDPHYLGALGIKTTDIAGYIINSAQMTTHFNVLREKGYHPQQILVDEAAPIFYVNENTAFPYVFIVVADNDIPCRLEQNKMFLRTLEIFGCQPERVKFQLMEGYTHCAYDKCEEFAIIWKRYMDEFS